MVSIALLSDIHGNLPAFAAVAADIRARQPDAVYVLGDMINGCPWSAEVLDRATATESVTRRSGGRVSNWRIAT
jgi:hypothetical protein